MRMKAAFAAISLALGSSAGAQSVKSYTCMLYHSNQTERFIFGPGEFRTFLNGMGEFGANLCGSPSARCGYETSDAGPVFRARAGDLTFTVNLASGAYDYDKRGPDGRFTGYESGICRPD